MSSVPFGNVNEQTLAEIWNGQAIRDFRNKLLNGEPDKRCSNCYSREKAGKSSMRQESNQKFYDPSQVLDETAKAPVYFDIRFSNVCNLKCRTCWHGASSSWYQEAKLLKRNMGDQAIMKSIDDPALFFEQIAKYCDSIEEFYFAGGEPLLMEEHYQVLDFLIEHKKDVRLRYNTNATQMHFKSKSIFAYWNAFSDVEILVSVDAFGKRNDAIRSGSKYSEILTNVKAIRQNCPHVKLKLAPTVSALNIDLLCELHQQWIDEEIIEAKDIYFNLLERPTIYNIKALSEEQKFTVEKQVEAWIEELEGGVSTDFVIGEYQTLVSYMWLEDWSHLQEKQRAELALLDTMRNEDLQGQLHSE